MGQIGARERVHQDGRRSDRVTAQYVGEQLVADDGRLGRHGPAGDACRARRRTGAA